MKKMWLLLCIFSTFSLFAEEATILHRVYVAPPEIEGADGDAPDTAAADDIPSLFTGAGSTLFSLINNRQAIIEASEEKAHSILRTVVQPEEEGTGLEFLLEGKDGEIVSSREVFPARGVNTTFKEFLERSADIFAPRLGEVTPVVRVMDRATDPETREVLDELMFVESMQTPFEASLWMGIATKRTNSESGSPLYLHFPFQYFGEITWYRVPNHGLSATLFLEYSDYLQPVDTDTKEFYILPGVGYTYRTLGRFSAGFFTGYNIGAIRIYAEENIVGEDWISLLAGESEWFLFQYFVMKPFVSYALNESWSLKSSFCLFIDLSELFQFGLLPDIAYRGEMAAEIQFLNIAVSYRWK
ncbi:MAG: hypothetical protein SVR04_13500 [Spirochaetota bacterium]|nr:hypothetical protein [Spirochaetota bacterium]